MEQQKKGSGCFWISLRVVEDLIDHASLIQILIYLILAKSTDADGEHSTARVQAVKRGLGFGDAQARRAIASLLDLVVPVPGFDARALVYDAEQVAADFGEVVPSKSDKFNVTYILPQDEGPRVWFPNELVTGYGQFKSPLARLKRFSDDVARLVLILYSNHDMERFGGTSPHVCHREYTMANKCRQAGYELWHAAPEHRFFKCPWTDRVLGERLSQNENILAKQQSRLFDALTALTTNGFVYEVVTVFDRADLEDMSPLYELDARTLHGYKLKGEEGLGCATATLASQWGYRVTDAAGRFHGTYAVIADIGVTPAVHGIYRLRFRVANPRNYSVSAAFARIAQCNDEWRENLRRLTSG